MLSKTLTQNHVVLDQLESISRHWGKKMERKPDSQNQRLNSGWQGLEERGDGQGTSSTNSEDECSLQTKAWSSRGLQSVGG